MNASLPPLVLSRQPRRNGTWSQARSWFGGKPLLGGQAWPRSSTSRPMHFMAQVDLEELARATGRSALPSSGALCFFIGAGAKAAEAGVIHVAQPDRAAPADPPADLAPVSEVGGDIPDKDDPAAPRLFPRWPLAFSAFAADAEGQIDPDAVGTRFLRRQYFFTAREAWKAQGDPPHPVWWHTAQLFAQHLRGALRHLPTRIEKNRDYAASSRAQLDKLRPKPAFGVFGRRAPAPSPELTRAQENLARDEAALAQIEQLAPTFERFVDEVSDWAGTNGSWRLMPPAAVEQLKTAFTRATAEFEEATRFRVPHKLDELETQTLLALMVADVSAFETLPGAVRDLINERYLLPTQAWHQMFGRGVDIQGNAEAECEDNVLLLQLVYDDMMGWRFGDMGAYQFWIRDRDLAAGNWGAARLTFECH